MIHFVLDQFQLTCICGSRWFLWNIKVSHRGNKKKSHLGKRHQGNPAMMSSSPSYSPTRNLWDNPFNTFGINKLFKLSLPISVLFCCIRHNLNEKKERNIAKRFWFGVISWAIVGTAWTAKWSLRKEGWQLSQLILTSIYSLIYSLLWVCTKRVKLVVRKKLLYLWIEW